MTERRRPETKKEEIIKKAKAFFAQKPFDSVSMSEIANSLGLTKPALYYHFKNKREIFQKTIEKIVDDFKKTIKEKVERSDKKKIFENLLDGYLCFALKEKGLLKILFSNFSLTDKKAEVYLEKKRKEFLREIEKVLEKVSFSKKISLSWLSLFLVGLLNNLVLENKFFSQEKKNEICSQIKRFLPKMVEGL